LEALPDDRIDTSDIPEQTDWSGAVRGLFYRPVKQQITLRLDADVVAWFKRQAPGGRGYQTAINRALRRHVERSETAWPGCPSSVCRGGRTTFLDNGPVLKEHFR
ncbi:MAG: BrnA antitoxin family protein, partial [Rhodospirillaceae bacterium]|nr:BrnA antitoxin family protein [Rhodospirillaceae bacterium]